jgi:hypothetical protein
MASPFDLTSFPGFKSFGIESYDTRDDDGAVFALQMSEKRSRGEGPYDAMLARLLDGAKTLLADEKDEAYDTSRNQGPGGTKTKQRRKSYSKLARWAITDDSRIWMLPRYSYWYKCFIVYPNRDNPRFLKKFDSNSASRLITLKNLPLLWRMRMFAGVGIAIIMEMQKE